MSPGAKGFLVAAPLVVLDTKRVAESVKVKNALFSPHRLTYWMFAYLQKPFMILLSIYQANLVKSIV